jgi:hypothetical protein
MLPWPMQGPLADTAPCAATRRHWAALARQWQQLLRCLTSTTFTRNLQARSDGAPGRGRPNRLEQ